MKPIAASVPVTGTTSATVIQSRPSMKFTRLTNQSPATSNSPRSIHHGRKAATRRPSGRAKITKSDRDRLDASSRGAIVIGRISAAAPTHAMITAAARITPRDVIKAGNAEACYRNGRDNDGDSAALRSRLAVRGSGVRPRQGVALKPRPQDDDKPGAYKRGNCYSRCAVDDPHGRPGAQALLPNIESSTRVQTRERR